MPSQNINLPASRYGLGGNATQNKGWSWEHVLTDPAIDSGLLADGISAAYLRAVRLYRTAKATPRQRAITIEIGESPSAAAASGDDLSDEFESSGSVRLQVPGGQFLDLPCSERADQTEPYTWNSADEVYTDAEFDALFDLPPPQLALAVLTLRDFVPSHGSAFGGRKLSGGAFGGRKLSGGAFGGRKFTF